MKEKYVELLSSQGAKKYLVELYDKVSKDEQGKYVLEDEILIEQGYFPVDFDKLTEAEIKTRLLMLIEGLDLAQEEDYFGGNDWRDWFSA